MRSVVPRMNGAHTVPFGQHRGPMHIAVTQQSEMRIYALCREGVGENVVKMPFGHSDLISFRASRHRPQRKSMS
jgi:hypothetical protein